MVRSTWDYQHHAETFAEVLEIIDKSSATLLNPLELIKWNFDKYYLKDLEAAGLPIVDTCWGSEFSPQHIEDAIANFATDEVVVKPTLSANADDTYRVSEVSSTELMSSLINTFSSRSYMIQPFLPSIVEEEEYSLFYFGGIYQIFSEKTQRSLVAGMNR